MCDENSAEHRDYTKYEYVSRNPKGKRYCKSKSNLTLKLNEDDVYSQPGYPNPGESIVDLNSESTTDEEKTDAYSKKYNAASCRVTTDAYVKAQPQYEESFSKVEDFEQIPTVNEQHHNEIKLNTRALSKHASTYELEKFKKNALIIFNQKNIDGLKPRLGTEKDVEALLKTFNTYGFEVVERTDLTKNEIIDELKSFSEMDFTDYGCIGVVVLTHGLDHGLLRAKDQYQYYSENNIISHFKVHDKPTLVTKPKFLIIQACRYIKNIVQDAAVYSQKLSQDVEENLEPYVLPVEADMLVLHSSYVGTSTHEEEQSGSWFIQSLCNKIDDLAATRDLEFIIREVKRDIAIDKYDEEFADKTFEIHPNKQIPVITSTLIRKLYLKKYTDASPSANKLQNKIISSKDELMGVTNSNAPLSLQFGLCSCFLDYFNYLRSCLGYYLEENPEDNVAQTYLELANTYEDGSEFNNSKKKMANVICSYLRTKSENCEYSKYLYVH